MQSSVPLSSLMNFRFILAHSFALIFALVTLVVFLSDSRREGLANDPYSPRRGESAKQRARDRGGIGLLGTID